MCPLAGVLAAGLSFSTVAAAQSKEYPTYVTGPQPNGSGVVGDGQIITPAELGIRVRAKAIALNPNVKSHTAAVLTMGATEAVEIFDTSNGEILQDYITFGTDSSGSYSGIAYSATAGTWCSARTVAMSPSPRSVQRACWKTTPK